MSDQPRPPKLLDRVREACRVRHYSIRTEDAYHDWAERYIVFHGVRHPDTMSEPEVNAFLTDLAVTRNVSASTQNQALCALLFLYDAVMGRPLNQLHVVRANRPRRLPVVLGRDEVRRVLCHLDGTNALIGRVLYGTGMRLLECLRLRVKDTDFALNQISIREGKGNKDRLTVLPDAVKAGLEARVGPGPELVLVGYTRDEVCEVPARLFIDHWRTHFCAEDDEIAVFPRYGG